MDNVKAIILPLNLLKLKNCVSKLRLESNCEDEKTREEGNKQRKIGGEVERRTRRKKERGGRERKGDSER
jgi:hypothetical protein